MHLNLSCLFWLIVATHQTHIPEEVSQLKLSIGKLLPFKVAGSRSGDLLELHRQVSQPVWNANPCNLSLSAGTGVYPARQ